jgi:hypothetical protein
VLLVLQGILFLLAELGAPCVRNELDKNSCDPGAYSATDCDSPVLTSKTVLRNLQGIASQLNNNHLSTSDTNNDKNEHPVLRNSLEYIHFIVDHTAVYQIENLHHGEHIKDISHLSACPLIFGF